MGHSSSEPAQCTKSRMRNTGVSVPDDAHSEAAGVAADGRARTGHFSCSLLKGSPVATSRAIGS